MRRGSLAGALQWLCRLCICCELCGLFSLSFFPLRSSGGSLVKVACQVPRWLNEKAFNLSGTRQCRMKRLLITLNECFFFFSSNLGISGMGLFLSFHVRCMRPPPPLAICREEEGWPGWGTALGLDYRPHTGAGCVFGCRVLWCVRWVLIRYQDGEQGLAWR